MECIRDNWKETPTRILMPPEAKDLVNGTPGYDPKLPSFCGLPIDFAGQARPEVAYVYGSPKIERAYEVDLTNGAVRPLP